LICIPTTGGTSADVSQFAIITDPLEKLKIAIISKSVVPDLALIDPLTLTTMDPFLTACTGLDALTHGIEAYVSNASSPMTDLHALEAIRLVSKYLVDSIKNPKDVELRTKIMEESAGRQRQRHLAQPAPGARSRGKGRAHECNAVLLDRDRVQHRLPSGSSASPRPWHRPARQEFQEKNACWRRSGRSRAAGPTGLTGRVARRSAPLSEALRDTMMTNPRRPKRRDIEVIYESPLTPGKQGCLEAPSRTGRRWKAIIGCSSASGSWA
jgi:hypothetical protein